jgi:hypothetical protein
VFLSGLEQEAGHRLLLDKAIALVDDNGNLKVNIKQKPVLKMKPLASLNTTNNVYFRIFSDYESKHLLRFN